MLIFARAVTLEAGGAVFARVVCTAGNASGQFWRSAGEAARGLPTRAHTTTLSACRPAAHNGGNRRSHRVTRRRLRGCWRRRACARRQRRLRRGRAGRGRVGRRLCRRFRPGRADGPSRVEAQERQRSVIAERCAEVAAAAPELLPQLLRLMTAIPLCDRFHCKYVNICDARI